jgi:hypothetical protein
MSELGMWTLGLALIMLILHGYAAVAPVKARVAITAFPRNIWIGRILATIALIWAAWLVYNMPLGRFDHLKKWLYLATPAVIGMTFVYMKDLLAPRAIGALMLLYPAPVLTAARLHDSSLSLVMSVIAYVLVVKGLLLLLYPWFFRKSIAGIMTSDARCCTMGFVGIAFAFILILLALLVY